MTTSTVTDRYGRADTVAFGLMHPKIDGRTGWENYQTDLNQPPIIEGTVIRLNVQRLPGDRQPKPGRPK